MWDRYSKLPCRRLDIGQVFWITLQKTNVGQVLWITVQKAGCRTGTLNYRNKGWMWDRYSKLACRRLDIGQVIWITLQKANVGQVLWITVQKAGCRTGILNYRAEGWYRTGILNYRTEGWMWDRYSELPYRRLYVRQVFWITLPKANVGQVLWITVQKAGCRTGTLNYRTKRWMWDRTLNYRTEGWMWDRYSVWLHSLTKKSTDSSTAAITCIHKNPHNLNFIHMRAFFGCLRLWWLNFLNGLKSFGKENRRRFLKL